MALDTFVPPRPPSVTGTDLTETARILTNSFGDGYKQDVVDGLNAVEGAVNLTWSLLYHSEADAIIAFFRAHVGHPFLWTPINSTAPRRWICTTWRRSYPYPDADSMTASFAERFTPG